LAYGDAPCACYGRAMDIDNADADEEQLLTPPLLHARNALFLDFDGTLVAIAPRPQDVHVAPWVVPTLRRVQTALDGALAVLTGRPLDEIDAFLTPLQPAGAGVHGAQRRSPDGRLWAFDAEPPDSVVRAAHALARHHPDLMIETKPAAIVVHYRAAPGLATICRTTMAAALQGHDDWMLLSGHAVCEIKPRNLSKATALQALMDEPPFARRVPVVVGDDRTDEDAFVAALEAGGQAIKVGPGSTVARWRLDNPADVCRWLSASAEALGAGQSLGGL